MTVRPLCLIQQKGTTSQGERRKKNATFCRRCGEIAYHKQRKRCSACGYPEAHLRRCSHTMLYFIDNWGKKAIRRRTTGTGRMRYLKDIPRKQAIKYNKCRLKNGFKEFSQPKRVKQRGKGKNKPEVKEAK